MFCHLGHRLVTQSLRLLRAEVWATGRRQNLARVTARSVAPLPALLEVGDVGVVCHARLVITGADGHRLHEELVVAGGRVRSGRFARIDTLRDLDALLRSAGEATPARRDGIEEVDPLVGRAWSSLASRARSTAAPRPCRTPSVASSPSEPRPKPTPSGPCSPICSIRSPPTSTSSPRSGPSNSSLFTEPERDQSQRDLDALRRRLEEIPEEIEREVAAVHRRFTDPEYHIFPAAVTILIPEERQLMATTRRPTVPRRRPTARRAIQDWLNLVDPDGAFLTTTELRAVFPHGFDPMPAEQRTELRARVAELDDDPAGRAGAAPVAARDGAGVGRRSSPTVSGSQPPRRCGAAEHGVQLRPAPGAPRRRRRRTRCASACSSGRSVRASTGVPTSPSQATPGRPAPSSGPRHGAARAACRSRSSPTTTSGCSCGRHAARPAASCRWRVGDLADERILQAGFVSLLGARRFFAVDDDETLESALRAGRRRRGRDHQGPRLLGAALGRAARRGHLPRRRRLRRHVCSTASRRPRSTRRR